MIGIGTCIGVMYEWDQALPPHPMTAAHVGDTKWMPENCRDMVVRVPSNDEYEILIRRDRVIVRHIGRGPHR